MTELFNYSAILIYAALVSGVALLMLSLNPWLGPKKPNPVKAEPFECGKDPIALPEGRLPIHFYVMAMLFVVFDVELVFLFPWAVQAKALGWFGLMEVGFFLLIVVAGFVYAWKQGAIEFK